LNSGRSSYGTLMCGARIVFIGFCHPIGWWTVSIPSTPWVETSAGISGIAGF
jgi:hypothetical protein